jgi:hypothetical protein
MFLRLRPWRHCRGQHRKVGRVVWEYIDAGVGPYNDRRVGRKHKAANNISPPTTTPNGAVVEEMSK